MMRLQPMVPEAVPEVIVSAWPSAPDTADAAAKVRSAVDSRCPGATVEVVVAVDVASTVIDVARRRGAGLVVMGTHGRGALARAVLGSVADHVLRHAPCPVVTLREPPRHATASVARAG